MQVTKVHCLFEQSGTFKGEFNFIGCTPAGLQSIQLDKVQRYVQRISYRHKEDRSMISPDYARNFICDHILGKRQQHTQITLQFS